MTQLSIRALSAAAALAVTFCIVQGLALHAGAVHDAIVADHMAATAVALAASASAEQPR